MYTDNKPIADAVARKKVLVAAHRGMCGGNIIWNTTLSYRNALMHGADMIEIDVSMTRDDVFLHSTTQKKKRNSERSVIFVKCHQTRWRRSMF